MDLLLSNNVDDPLGLYDDIVTAQQALDEAALHRMNARLVLILANQVGDRRVLRQALQAARDADAGESGDERETGATTGTVSGAAAGR